MSPRHLPIVSREHHTGCVRKNCTLKTRLFRLLVSEEEKTEYIILRCDKTAFICLLNFENQPLHFLGISNMKIPHFETVPMNMME